MAQVANPRKQFQFTVVVQGLNPFLAQEVTSPDFEFDVVEHGDTNFLVKTAGLIKFGNININKISVSTGSDSFVWDWMLEIQSTQAGGGLLPSLYKRVVEIQLFSTDNVTIIDAWRCFGAWPCKVNGIEQTMTRARRIDPEDLKQFLRTVESVMSETAA